MTPFLKLVAEDLYRKLDGNFEHTTIIFPNKRASLFFNEYLWSNAHGQTMWTPEYTTISELFASLSDVTVGDSIYLTVKLWEVYQQMMQPSKTFDQLYPLMEMMLSDFQDIDSNMVEPEKLFLNIADWKEMTDFSFLEEEQREAIEAFFGKILDKENPNTPIKSHFNALWCQMANIYKAYRKSLLEGNDGMTMVYEGMSKRQVIEALSKEDSEEFKRVNDRLHAQTYVMVGFNVLNKTEMELFRHIKKHHNAKFYWDYDISYAKNNRQSSIQTKYEAGQFILENIRVLGNEFAGQDLFKNMQSPKQIAFIQSPTDNAQARFIHTWLKEHLKENEPLRETAVILCDEKLLQPVLHSIGDVPSMNVTMGYPLSATPAYSLIQVLLDLQVHGRTQTGTWCYKQVAAVLKHALIQKLSGVQSREKLQILAKYNVIFPGNELFEDDVTMKKIFSSVSGKELTAYLSEIISMVGCCYQKERDYNDQTLQLYKESLFMTYTIINRFHTLQESHATIQNLNNEMLSRLILQMMEQATIPFHGEPAIGLQVMGLLETRNLDFKNVIMLSVNEGQLPKSDKRASLIPYTLRAAFGMTTIEKEVSLYAYYYYRLIQRAEHITLLYNSSTEGGKKGEMSRFMLQTLAEKNELFGPLQEIELKSFTSTSEAMPNASICVKKDEHVMAALMERFNQDQILSPSAINTYMKCPLMFYLNYVAGLRPKDEVSDDIDRPLFGTIFHDTMHHLYMPWEGKPFPSQEVRRIAANETSILQALNNAFATNLFHYPATDKDGNTINYGMAGGRKLLLNGTQLINRHVIKEFVLNQLDADALMAEELEQEGGYWQIISQEQKYTTKFHLASLNSFGNGDGTQDESQMSSRVQLLSKLSSHELLLGGYIDRLDLLASPSRDLIRIVDYKTSSKAHAAKTLDELFNPQKCAGNYHLMQAFYYCWVLTAEGAPYEHDAVVPALMYCAKDYGDNYSGILKLAQSSDTKKETIENFKQEYGEGFYAMLSQKIKEIFTPYINESTPNGVFCQCEDEQNCAFCDFLTFCRRHSQKNQ